MSPIFIQDGKILISGDKLRGCCCGGRWRIRIIKVAAFECASGGGKGAQIDLTANPPPETCRSFKVGNVYPNEGDITGPIVVEDTTYYELQNFPRTVTINQWTNEFPDGLSQEYPNPCSSDTFLLMNFIKVCLPLGKSVVDGDIVKNYARTCPPSPLEDIAVSYLDCGAGIAIYEFTSTVSGNDGSIGIEANAPENCKGKDSLKTLIIRKKRIQYTVNKIPDPENPEEEICCLSNPIQLSYGNDEEGQPVLEDIKCYVACCVDGESSEDPPTKTYWEIHVKLQILCTGGVEWVDVENPSGLEAPKSSSEPGTGDPGTGNEETSSWLIAECLTCNRPCYIECTDENEPDESAIKANLDLPPFLDMDEASICPE